MMSEVSSQGTCGHRLGYESPQTRCRTLAMFARMILLSRKFCWKSVLRGPSELVTTLMNWLRKYCISRGRSQHLHLLDCLDYDLLLTSVRCQIVMCCGGAKKTDLLINQLFRSNLPLPWRTLNTTRIRSPNESLIHPHSAHSTSPLFCGHHAKDRQYLRTSHPVGLLP